MRRPSLLRGALVLLLLACAGALALVVLDPCRGRPGDGPGGGPGGGLALETAGGGEGALRAGAARAVLAVPAPVAIAGYGPMHPPRPVGEPPPGVRAVVLAVGAVQVGLVSLDLLQVPEDVVEEVRARAGLDALWVTATHTHTSLGGYDARPLVQLAGTGRFRPEVRRAVVEGALRVLGEARARLVPVQLEVGTRESGDAVSARSGEPPDVRLTRVVLRGEAGAVAELWHWGAHPTLAGRDPERLEVDYPGRLDGSGGPVRLLLQGAVGNASASVPEGEGTPVERYARSLGAAGESIAPVPVPAPVALRFSRVRVGLPAPDASRLVPTGVQTLGAAVLCHATGQEAEVSALRLGPLTWVALPFEPTSGAARVLRAQSGATGVVGLANGYLGYLETRELAGAGEGESRLQYFSPTLLEALAAAATRAVEALR